VLRSSPGYTLPRLSSAIPVRSLVCPTVFANPSFFFFGAPFFWTMPCSTHKGVPLITLSREMVFSLFRWGPLPSWTEIYPQNTVGALPSDGISLAVFLEFPPLWGTNNICGSSSRDLYLLCGLFFGFFRCCLRSAVAWPTGVYPMCLLR